MEAGSVTDGEDGTLEELNSPAFFLSLSHITAALFFSLLLLRSMTSFLLSSMVFPPSRGSAGLFYYISVLLAALQN